MAFVEPSSAPLGFKVDLNVNGNIATGTDTPAATKTFTLKPVSTTNSSDNLITQSDAELVLSVFRAPFGFNYTTSSMYQTVVRRIGQ